MHRRCEATRITAAWTRKRCKRNATVVLRGRHLCEQHAKIDAGMRPDVRLDAPHD